MTELTTAGYWERRYLHGGFSGAGSRGESLSQKIGFAHTVYGDVQKEGGCGVLDLGCGDGRFAAGFVKFGLEEQVNFTAYRAVDISPKALEIAEEFCRHNVPPEEVNRHMSFELFRPDRPEQPITPGVFGLGLSLEVIFHILEDDIYDLYMRTLFDRCRTVFIQTAADPEPVRTAGDHIVWRDTQEWVWTHRPEAVCIHHIPRPFGDRSFSDFFVYRTGP
jgi:SAM-dependent methyltransferase